MLYTANQSLDPPPQRIDQIRPGSVSAASEARASQSRAGISRLYKRAEPSQAKLLSEPSWMSQAGQNAGYGKAPAPAPARAEFESGALSHQCRPAEVRLQRYETRVH